ncbi:hypothetical protein D3C75_1369320 [compost metagenome]
MRNATGHEACQVIVAATDQMTFEHLIDQTNIGLELSEIFAFMVVQRDLREHRD